MNEEHETTINHLAEGETVTDRQKLRDCIVYLADQRAELRNLLEHARTRIVCNAMELVKELKS